MKRTELNMVLDCGTEPNSNDFRHFLLIGEEFGKPVIAFPVQTPEKNWIATQLSHDLITVGHRVCSTPFPYRSYLIVDYLRRNYKVYAYTTHKEFLQDLSYWVKKMNVK